MMMNFNSMFAFAKSDIPEYIKVGLFFRDSAKSIINLKSTAPLSLGSYQGNQFTELLNLGQETNLYVRKDAHYIGSNGNYVEFTGDVNTSSTLNIKGPYHVKIGSSFPNKEQAIEFLNTLSIGEQPFLAFESGWMVYAGLFNTGEQAQNAANAIQSTSGMNVTVVNPSSTRVQVLNAQDKVLLMYDASQLELHFKSNSIINVDGRNYRGSVMIRRQVDSDMTIINYLPLEEYLYGVVPREMPALWPREALKAQAVVARSYAIASFNKFSNLGFNVCSTTSSQVYGGFDGEHSNSNAAVDETRGSVLTYNGNIVTAFYHSNSGGQTENSENIWSNPVAYIKGVKDDYSLDAPNSTWQVAYSKAEIRNMLEQNNIFIGEVKDIVVTSISVNGRILTLEVIGTTGKEVMEKQRSRTVFGLRSSWFEVAGDVSITPMVSNGSDQVQPLNLEGKHVISSNGVTKINNLNNTRIYNGQQYKEVTVQNPQADFVFSGRGFGHGLGMSQHGARKMAELNLTFLDILNHYYTGIKVE